MAKESQNEFEIAGFLRLIKGAGSFLEIGSRYGETLMRVAEVLKPGATIISIELPDAGWGRSDSQPVLEKNIDILRERGFNAHVFFVDSHEQISVEIAKENGPYDAMFIDGDHSYGGALQDWQKYGSLAKIVGFHDVASKWGIGTLWPIISESQRYTEIVDKTIQPDRRMGIGVIYRG